MSVEINNAPPTPTPASTLTPTPPPTPTPLTPAPDIEGENVNAIAEKLANEMFAEKLKTLPTEQEYKQFRDWQETQKTEAQKHADALQELKLQAELAKSEVIKLQQRESLRKAGISDKYNSYVQFEVQNTAKQKNLTFDTALSLFMETNKDVYTNTSINNDNSTTREMSVSTGGSGIEPPKSKMMFNFSGMPKKD